MVGSLLSVLLGTDQHYGCTRLGAGKPCGELFFVLGTGLWMYVHIRAHPLAMCFVFSFPD